MNGVAVFLPRIRFRRATRQGAVWVTEALFPNYVFARFDWRRSLRQVHHARGVSGVVHFRDRWPTVPDDEIESLRQEIGDDVVHEIRHELQPGDSVRIAGGAFHGLEAVVRQAMSGRERVLVLLEFLGRQTAVEVPVAQLTRTDDERKQVL